MATYEDPAPPEQLVEILRDLGYEPWHRASGLTQVAYGIKLSRQNA